MNMNKKPIIRFNNYIDEWEQRKLDECLSEITYGFTNPMSDTETGPWKITAKDIVDGKIDYSSARHTSPIEYDGLTDKSKPLIGDLLLTKDGTLGRTAIVNAENICINQSVALLRFNEKCSPQYAKTLLDTPMYQKQMIDDAGGGTIKHIYITKVDKMLISIPSKEEQEQLVSFFNNLDNLITLHQRMCDETKELKKFMLQKMFPKNGEQVPEIRFAGFTDEWEHRKLGTLCERVTRKNKNGESDLPLTIASQYGLIDQRDFFNKVVAAKDMSNYYLLKKGEFAYNKSYSNGFDYGSIKRLNAYEQGCLSTLYICFGITSDDIESDYLECFFDTLKWYSDITMICAEGARNHGLLNVDTKAFFDEVTIEMPSSKEEQRKISAYLSNLDNLITLHQCKCDDLKEVKKYMLQNMFPKN